MDRRKQTIGYLLSDFLTASITWLLINFMRYYEIAQYEGFQSLGEFLLSDNVVKVHFLIPFCWLILYYFSGYYNQSFGKSRIGELFSTFVTVSIGVVIIFFIVILNDLTATFHSFYKVFLTYYALQFLLTYLARQAITNRTLRKIQRREWALNVLVIGAGRQAVRAKNDLIKLGYRPIGFVEVNRASASAVAKGELLGAIEDLQQLLAEYTVDELVLAPEPSAHDDEIIGILYSLYHYKRPIKIWVEKNNPLSRARVKTIHGIPLIDVTANNFSDAAKNIKNVIDKVASALVIILFSPLYAYIAIRVKAGSEGPVFFRQERIGYRGKPFTIYKFRTMYNDAEQQGSLLTDKNDPRVTPFGRYLRKYRLDEIPQFWNVLKGEMSLVGPRPEQRYYIEQIVKQAPYYYLLHNVRPGITSWGMVKYGYAETVDKMIERLDYDIMYYENMSLTLDITILIYTIRTVFTGKGV